MIKNVFYGAAMQGAVNRQERAGVNKALIEFIKSRGFNVLSEQTKGANAAEAARILEQQFGKLPEDERLRWEFIRARMIRSIEDPETCCCIFDVSTPSSGTGIEVAHAYLRPRMGLPAIPVLALYQRGYWPSGLSTMLRGIGPEEAPHFALSEYMDVEEAKTHISDLLRKVYA